MGFNSAFKGLKLLKYLTLNLLTTTIVPPPSNASKWQMGFNSAFKGLKLLKYLTLNLLTTTIVAPPSNASKWQMGFNSALKGLTYPEPLGPTRPFVVDLYLYLYLAGYV